MRAATSSRVPRVAGALGLLGGLLLVVPVVALVARAPWGTVLSNLGSPAAVQALELSGICSTATLIISIIFGVPLAWVLARSTLPGMRVLRAAATLPMVLPPVVGGIALLMAFSRYGPLGRVLFSVFGIQLTYSIAGVILAETFVAMPFLVITVEAALGAVSPELEEVSATLGAGPWRTFLSVTLPVIGPSVAAGCALTWARALGEFGATITFAGDIAGRTQTLPLAVYLALQRDEGLAVSLSIGLLAISLAVLIGLRGRWLGAVRT